MPLKAYEIQHNPLFHRIRTTDDQFNADKDSFWKLLAVGSSNMSTDDYVIIASDLNGHVGGKADVMGEKVLEHAMRVSSL